jgi:putative DNA methylase
MVWDYPEANVLADATGSLGAAIELIADPLALLGNGPRGAVKQMAAQAHEPRKAPLYSTDPPYYDNVPYADLADFFYVWLRKMLAPLYPSLLGTVLVPKVEELVADPFRLGGKEASRTFFEGSSGKRVGDVEQ